MMVKMYETRPLGLGFKWCLAWNRDGHRLGAIHRSVQLFFN